jgi:Tfp pilus assembly ATPase PilU
MARGLGDTIGAVAVCLALNMVHAQRRNRAMERIVNFITELLKFAGKY